MEEERIVLLDQTGKSIGSAPKLATHHSDTPLHLAFSCYVFDDYDRFLVTQRALSKKVWPGVWTNSFCGHPEPNEPIESAIIRRAQQELGMRLHSIKIILPNYRYKTPAYNGIVENEICPVFFARAASPVEPNPDEVESYLWTSWQDYANALQNTPENYSYWAKDQFDGIVKNGILQQNNII